MMMRVAPSSRKDAKMAKTQRKQCDFPNGLISLLLCVFAPFAPLREQLIIIITLACIFDSTSLGQTRKPMVPSDILRIAAVTDAQISPNGQWIVYTVSSTEGDRSRSTLWLARVGLDTLEAPTSIAPQTRQPDRDWREIPRRPSLLLPSSWTASTPRW